MKASFINREQVKQFQQYFPADIFDDLITGDSFCIAVCDDAGTGVGAMACALEHGVCEIQWACVSEKARRQGILTMLYQKLLFEMCKLDDVYGIDFWAPYEEKYFPFFQFADEMGFVYKNDSFISVNVSLEEMLQHDFFKMPVKTNACISLRNLPKNKKNQLLMNFAKHHYRDETPAQLESIYDPDASFFVLKGNQVAACILVRIYQNRILEISYLYADPSASAMLVPVLESSCHALIKKNIQQAELRFAYNNESTEKIVDKLVMNSKRVKVCHEYLMIK